jgi:hypothetical protein
MPFPSPKIPALRAVPVFSRCRDLDGFKPAQAHIFHIVTLQDIDELQLKIPIDFHYLGLCGSSSVPIS